MQMNESQNQVELTPAMVRYSDLVKRIAKRVFLIDIKVVFGEWEERFPIMYVDKTLCVNVRVTGEAFFEMITLNIMSLTIHELACECTNTCQSHSQLCAQIGAELTIIALKEPEFFDMEVR